MLCNLKNIKSGDLEALQNRKYIQTKLGANAYQFIWRLDLRERSGNVIADAVRAKLERMI